MPWIRVVSCNDCQQVFNIGAANPGSPLQGDAELMKRRRQISPE